MVRQKEPGLASLAKQPVDSAAPATDSSLLCETHPMSCWRVQLCAPPKPPTCKEIGQASGGDAVDSEAVRPGSGKVPAAPRDKSALAAPDVSGLMMRYRSAKSHHTPRGKVVLVAGHGRQLLQLFRFSPLPPAEIRAASFPVCRLYPALAPNASSASCTAGCAITSWKSPQLSPSDRQWSFNEEAACPVH